MIKDRLLDGKELLVGLKAHWLKWSKVIMVELMIILFQLKLDKVYYIEVMN